jgi:hypothetical protein
MTDIPEDVMKLAREMREGLEGVSPGFGRWIHLFGERTVYTRDPSDGCRITAVVRADVPGDNATLDHIARCGPDNIRSLLDTIDSLIADRAAQAERMARMEGDTDLPYPPIVISLGEDGAEQGRVGAHEYKTAERPNGGIITIGVFLGNHSWVHAELSPSDALMFARLILSRPSVRALSQEGSDA